jgi:putative DNA-invertase from lambdoid prophage Rac
MKCYGYIRVSTSDQADSGLGLEAQRGAITREYEAKFKPLGYEWGGIYEDPAVSGRRPLRSRPAGLRLATAATTGDAILFSKLDRAFRSTIDCLQTIEVWNQQKVRAVFLDFNLDTDTPVGEFVLTIMAAFAKMERRRISERIRDAKAVEKAQGNIMSIPMTVKAVRTGAGRCSLYVQPDVFALGMKVVEWRNRGVSWSALRATLRDAGITKPKPKVYRYIKENDWWSRTALARLHEATVKTIGWLNQGKVKWPPGWKKPDTLDVQGLTGDQPQGAT